MVWLRRLSACVAWVLVSVMGAPLWAQVVAPPSAASERPALVPEVAPPGVPVGMSPGATVEAAEGSRATPVALSSEAQRLYAASRPSLVQIRTLLSGQGSQSSVGSGFLVAGEQRIITNYHVISQVALEPERYRLSYSHVDGRQGSLRLLAVDVVHDLAVLAPVVSPAAPDVGLRFREATTPLRQGEQLYSLGHPLDVGFAVVEGVYNGLVERSHIPSIFFSGSLNPGMSGGPALDAQGRVIGVNVATRLDGQQVSFLVPAEHAVRLLRLSRKAAPLTKAVYPEITRQLTLYQADLVQRFLAQAWRSGGHARYRVPVPQEVFMRCWGSSTSAEAKGLQFERSQCRMNQGVFVTSLLQTGTLSTQHEFYDGSRLGAWRFARQMSDSLANEHLGGGRHRTPARCTQRFIEAAGLPLRATVCLSAYKKLPGLYDLTVLAMSADAETQGVLGRFDAQGVAHGNAMKLAAAYLKGFGWTASPSR
jgi:S1-C subfamily serine protease